MYIREKEDNLYQLDLNKSAQESIIERIIDLPGVTVYNPIHTKRNSDMQHDKQSIFIKYRSYAFFIGFDYYAILHVDGRPIFDRAYPDCNVFDSLFDLINQHLGKVYIILRETTITKSGVRRDELNFYAEMK